MYYSDKPYRFEEQRSAWQRWFCPIVGTIAFSLGQKQMTKQEGITEQLKADNQVEWVDRMDTIKESAVEIVNAEIL